MSDLEKAAFILSIVSTLMTLGGGFLIWLRGGFKKDSDLEGLKIDMELNQDCIRNLQSLPPRVKSLEESHMDMKKNYADAVGILSSKIDDLNKHIMDMTFKLGTVYGRQDQK